MSKDFDAYHKWLGIPPAEQPPDHYRLLGIPRFEQDPEVIQQAADRQMAHVQSQKLGPHAERSQQILNELAQARLVLLHSQKRAGYDARLRGQQAAAIAPAAPPPPAPRQAVPVARLVEETAPRIQIAAAPEPVAGPGQNPVVLIGAGAAALLLVVGMLAFAFFRGGSEPTVAGGTVAQGTPAAKPVEEPPKTSSPATGSSPTSPPSGVAKTIPPEIDRTPPPSRPSVPIPITKTAPPTPTPVELPPPAIVPAVVTPADEIAAVLPLLKSAGAPAGEPAKLPAPPGEEQAKAALRSIRDIFKSDYAKATTLPLKAELARTLLANARDTKDDPTSVYVLLEEVARLAGEAGEVELAIGAVDDLAERFAVHPVELKSKVLAEISRDPRGSTNMRSLVSEQLALAQAAIDSGDYALARALLDAAAPGATKLKDLAIARKVADLRKSIQDRQRADESLQAALEKLKTDPTDPNARHEVGLYLAVHRQSLAAALPLLAKTPDEPLAKLARAELAGPKGWREMLDLGDGWYELAALAGEAAKPRWQARAVFWYELSIPDSTGLLRARAEKRLRELAETGIKAEGELPAAAAPSTPADSTPGKPPAAKGRFHQEIAITSRNEIGYRVGKVTRGEKLVFKYLAGQWKGWGRIASASPDDPQAGGGDRSRMAICVQVDEGLRVVALVPPGTAATPFVWTADRDCEVVLRINDNDNEYANNPDAGVKYQLTIQ